MLNSPQANSPSKSAANPLRILLVDDQKFVRYKLKEMLSTDENLEIVGTAGDGEMAIAQVESLKPDVILIDIEMPKMNGIEATEIISQRFPECKILIFSSYEHQEYVQKIIAAGADGYLLKSTPAEDLVTAIHSVCKGYSHFGSQLIKKIQLDDRASYSTTATVSRASEEQLTSTTSADSNTTDRLGIYDLGTRQTDELSPLINRWLVWGGISVLTMIILAIPASAILKYKTVVRARTVVRPAEELHQVRAAVEGEVGEILVNEGQKVERGQAIATVDSRSKTDQNQLNKSIEQQKLQLDRLNAQIASLASQIIIAETRSSSSEIAAAKSELESVRRNYQNTNYESNDRIEKLQQDVKAIEANLNATKAKYNRYKSIAEAGAITTVQLSEAESAVSQQEQKLEIARSQLEQATATATANPTTADLSAFEERIEQAERKSRATIAGLNREREALTARRIQINKQLGQDTEELNRVNRELSKSKIIATATGTIFDLDLNDRRQTIRLGQQIAQIVPEDSKVEMKATVSPQDITELEVGQKVKMEFSACPDTNYAPLGGTVARIAPDNSETPSQDSFLVEEASNTNYEVIIAPDSNSFGRRNQCSLQLGMESQVDIISREETLLQYIIRKAKLTA